MDSDARSTCPQSFGLTDLRTVMTVVPTHKALFTGGGGGIIMLYQKQKLAVMNTTQIFPTTDRQKQTKIGQCWIVREGFCTSILQLNYQMFLCMGLCQTNASFRAKSIYQSYVY